MLYASHVPLYLLFSTRGAMSAKSRRWLPSTKDSSLEDTATKIVTTWSDVHVYVCMHVQMSVHAWAHICGLIARASTLHTRHNANFKHTF